MMRMARARVVGEARDAEAAALALRLDPADDGGVFRCVSAPPAPPFVAVELALSRSSSGTLAGLSHVSALVRSFLDVSSLSSVSVAAAKFPGERCVEWLALAAKREARKLASWSSELVRAYKQHQFATCANVLAANGDIEALRWLRVHYYVKGKFEGVERAALWHGQLHVLRFLEAECFNRVSEDKTPLQDAIARVAAQGRMDLIKWVVETKGEYEVGWGAMDAACAYDHMDIVMYLNELIGNRCTRRGLELAALHGHLHVVMWLHEFRYYEVRTFLTLENAIRGGHLEVVQFILLNVQVARESWAQDARSAAVRHGKVDILDWIDQFALTNESDTSGKVYKPPKSAVFDAAKTGHLDVIEWLHDRGYYHDDVDKKVCMSEIVVRGAVAGGHERILQWVHDVYAHVLDKHTLRKPICVDSAAHHGRESLLPFLGEYPKYYTFTTIGFDDAAANGHLQVVKWLRANTKTPCTNGAMDRAATNGHLKVVRFLHNRRKEGCTKAAMDGAARNGHLEVVRFLFENRSEYCSSTGISETFHVDVLDFLRTNGQLRNVPGEKWPSFEETAKRGNLPMLQWLLQWAPDGRRQLARRVERIAQAARAENHFHVLRWLEAL